MDIDWGPDSLHCALLQSLLVLTSLLWIRAGFHFTHVGLMLADWKYTQRSGLINLQYKDGIKCQGVQDSLQAYHTVFTGLKRSHLTLLAGFGCMKICICPGRLNNWASAWFSCLNSLYLQISYSGMSDILDLILPSAMLIHDHFQKCSSFTPTDIRTDTGLCEQKGGFSWRQENELVICAV